MLKPFPTNQMTLLNSHIFQVLPSCFSTIHHQTSEKESIFTFHTLPALSPNHATHVHIPTILLNSSCPKSPILSTWFNVMASYPNLDLSRAFDINAPTVLKTAFLL